MKRSGSLRRVKFIRLNPTYTWAGLAFAEEKNTMLETRVSNIPVSSEERWEIRACFRLLFSQLSDMPLETLLRIHMSATDRSQPAASNLRHSVKLLPVTSLASYNFIRWLQTVYAADVFLGNVAGK